MHALWLEKNKVTFRDDVPKPVPVSGHALVQVLLAGICSTDLECVKGYTPFSGVLGHEFVGKVVEASDDAWIGRRVVSDINITCGTCSFCRDKLSAHCRNRAVIGIRKANGAFAQFVTVPLANLHPVPDSVSDETAVFTEPLAAALAIQEQYPIRSRDRVLVIGAGRLGQLVAQTLALTGCDLTVVTRYAPQRNLLAKKDIPSISENNIPNHEMNVVVDATGTPEGFELSLEAVRPRGVVILKSTCQKNAPIDLSPVVIHELTVLGSRCGPMDKAMDQLANGQINPLPMIAGCYPLKEGLAALKRAAEPGVFKVLLEP